MQKITTMEEFTKTVKNAFVAAFPDHEISAAPVTKNNGLCLTGITARSHSTEIAPTIYLEPYFANLQSGSSPLTTIIGEIISNYKAALKEAANTDAAAIYNFDSIKHKICYRLVNKKLNHRLLTDMPHRDFMDDLAIIYCLQLEATDDNVKIIKITDSLATGIWKVDEETLWRLASENTPRLNRGCVIPMDNMFAEIVGLPSSTDEDIEQYDGFDITLGSDSALPLYIATCASKVSGASVILYKGLLNTLGEKLGNFYLLPSSIHEILIFPGDPKDAESMLEMVKTVNTEDVREDEILSDNCMWYNAATHSLKLITQ